MRVKEIVNDAARVSIEIRDVQQFSHWVQRSVYAHHIPAEVMVELYVDLACDGVGDYGLSHFEVVK